jgi:hypothetical protein
MESVEHKLFYLELNIIFIQARILYFLEKRGYDISKSKK